MGIRVGRVRWWDGRNDWDVYNGWMGTVVGWVRWLDGYNGWTDTMVRRVQRLDGYDG